MKTRFKTNFLIYLIAVCFLAFIALSIILQVNTEKSIQKLEAGNQQTAQLFNVHSQVQKVITDAVTIESKIRGLVITGDEAFTAGVQDTMINLKVDLDQLQKLAMTDLNKSSFDHLAALADQKIALSNELLNTYFRKGKAAAEQRIATRQGTTIRDSITLISVQIEQQLQQSLEDTLSRNNARAETVLAVSRTLAIVSAIATLLLSIIIVRHLNQQHILINRLEQSNISETDARKQIEKISGDIYDLYNLAPCGYHSLDKDGYFVAINQTELNWLGYTRDEIIGRMKFSDIIDEKSAAQFKVTFPEFKKSGKINNLHFNIITKQGQSLPMILSSTAVYDAEGNYVSSRSTMFDISEQLKNEKELKEAKRLAEDSVRVKEQFLANMSHEIRTPINSVIGFTNLLQKTPLSEEQAQFVNLVQSASENLLTIINDILDISKIEAGMLRIEKNPFSLRGLCSSVETMFYHKAREKNLAFSITTQPTIPDTLMGDPVRLTQILVNLISNAIKFTQQGNITVNITAARQTANTVHIRFSVKDTGIGIPKDKVETVFERFEQGETDTTRKYGGTGLGLSIVKNLVQLQGGAILVKSEYKKGTEFLVELEYEILPVENAPIEVSEMNVNENGASSFDGVKILIAEDNHMNQLLMKYTFRNWKINFELAENGKEAVEWLQKEPFDLLLLDIQMPIMDGYATAKAIRSELNNTMPIIAMTAHALAGEREKCLSYGMNDYISKPIHENELFQLLKKYLSSKRVSVDSLKDEFRFINLDFLYDLVMGNEAFLKNIIRQFLKQFPGEMDALQQAVEQNNGKQVAFQAHHIQSTVSVLGKGTPFFQQLEKLEQLGKRKTTHEVLKTEFSKLNEYKVNVLQETDRLLNANII